jgi:hypothetical protein
MSHEAAISPWWAFGFGLLLFGFFVALGVGAAREVLRARRLSKLRAGPRQVHPSSQLPDGLLADVDRQFAARAQFAEPLSSRVRDGGAPVEVARLASTGDTTTMLRVRPFDLRRGDVLDDESMVLGSGWPDMDRSHRTRFVVPVRDVFGVHAQRSWPMAQARFECAEVTR